MQFHRPEIRQEQPRARDQPAVYVGLLPTRSSNCGRAMAMEEEWEPLSQKFSKTGRSQKVNPRVKRKEPQALEFHVAISLNGRDRGQL
jgi:hypothetical protein